MQGQLSTRTFELRTASALDSRDGGDLRRLLSDLPSRAGRLLAQAEAYFWPENEPLQTHAPAVDIALPRRTGGLIVGRSSSCHIVLDHPSVWRQHAVLARGAQGWTIRDLHSTNGTRLRDRRVGLQAVAIGDVVRLGELHVRLL